MAFKHTEVRLAETLIELSGDFATRCEHGFGQHLRLTQQKLADLVGASRPVISTILNKLRDQGILGYSREYVCEGATISKNSYNLDGLLNCYLENRRATLPTPLCSQASILGTSARRLREYDTEPTMSKAYLAITRHMAKSNRSRAGEVYTKYKQHFIETIQGAHSKELHVREAPTSKFCTDSIQQHSLRNIYKVHSSITMLLAR